MSPNPAGPPQPTQAKGGPRPIPQKRNIKARASRAATKAKRKSADRPVSPVACCPKVSAHAAQVKCPFGQILARFAFGRVIKRKGERYKGFRTKAKQIARDLGISLSNLMAVMSFETNRTFDTGWSASRAVGLIQWTPIAVEEMNKTLNPDVTLDELAAMSPLRQLSYVKKYLKHQQKTLKNDLTKIENLYLSVLWPKAVGLPANKPFRPIGRQADALYVPGTTYMTRARVRKVLLAELREGLKRKNTTTHCIWPWEVVPDLLAI
ncbi:MAG TPA: hypothetical protein VF297_03040 [Pyrinomonadaceae bacterium]